MHWECVLECPGTRGDEERSANSTQRPPVAELAQWPGSGDVAFRSVQDSEMGEVEPETTALDCTCL